MTALSIFKDYWLIRQETVRYFAWRVIITLCYATIFWHAVTFESKLYVSCTRSRLRNLWSLQSYITSAVSFDLISKNRTLRNTKNGLRQNYEHILNEAPSDCCNQLYWVFHNDSHVVLSVLHEHDWARKVTIGMKLCSPLWLLATEATHATCIFTLIIFYRNYRFEK